MKGKIIALWVNNTFVKGREENADLAGYAPSVCQKSEP